MKAVCIMFFILLHTFIFSESIILYNGILQLAVPFFITISGFMFSVSASKSRSYSVYKAYSGNILFRKFEQLLTPAIITYFIYIIFNILKSEAAFAPLNLISDFIFGRYGAGSYYCSIMVQFVLIIPLMYACISKKPLLFFFVFVVFTIMYELVCGWTSVDSESIFYRPLFFRYTVHVCLK